MKHLRRLIALLVLLCMLSLLLCACAHRLDGTYTAVGITLTFDGDTFTAEKGEAKGSGTYEIVEGEDETRIVFTFTTAEGTYATTFGSILISPDGVRFDESESYIKVAGIPFAKVTEK